MMILLRLQKTVEVVANISSVKERLAVMAISGSCPTLHQFNWWVKFEI